MDIPVISKPANGFTVPCTVWNGFRPIACYARPGTDEFDHIQVIRLDRKTGDYGGWIWHVPARDVRAGEAHI